MRRHDDGTGLGGGLRAGGWAPRLTSWGRRSPGGLLPAVVVMNEDVVRGWPVTFEGQQAAMHLHVDDSIFLGAHSGRDEPQAVDLLMEDSDEARESLGLVVLADGGRTRNVDLDKVIICSVSRIPVRIEVTTRKIALIFDAFTWAAGFRIIRLDTLARWVGLWIWGALLRRCLLSVPQLVFRFNHLYRGSYAESLQPLHRELLAMAHLTAFMFRDLGAPLAQGIFATDALGSDDKDHGGIGIVGKRVDARTAELAYEFGACPVYTVSKFDGSITGFLKPQTELRRRTPSSGSPRARLSFGAFRWTDICWGRSLWQDPVCLGEGRASKWDARLDRSV